MILKHDIKDKKLIQHEHDLVYKIMCLDCPATYIGKTARRLDERINEHGKRDKKSHVLKHSETGNHREVTLDNVKILAKSIKTTDKRKISERSFVYKIAKTYNKYPRNV